MKLYFLILLPLLAGCQLLRPHLEDFATEASSTSVASAKKYGMFLRSYSVEPSTTYLFIKEAFVEQRFKEGNSAGQISRLDTTRANANLIIVLAKPPKLGTLHVQWNLFLADNVPLDNRQQLTYCNMPGEMLLRFELKNYQPASNRAFPLRLQLMQGSATNVVKTVDFIATPL